MAGLDHRPIQTMTTDMSGSAFAVHPIETHLFKPGHDDFLCASCHRPRALHANDSHAATPSNLNPSTTRIRSQAFFLALRGKLLSDRRIRFYSDRGYYSEAFRTARRALWERQRSAANPHFIQHQGRLIYSP